LETVDNGVSSLKRGDSGGDATYPSEGPIPRFPTSLGYPDPPAAAPWDLSLLSVGCGGFTVHMPPQGTGSTLTALI